MERNKENANFSFFIALSLYVLQSVVLLGCFVSSSIARYFDLLWLPIYVRVSSSKLWFMFQHDSFFKRVLCPPFVYALLAMWKFLFIHFFVVFFFFLPFIFMHKGQSGWMRERLAHSHAISILLTFSPSRFVVCKVNFIEYMGST